jgi:hypothetical protein
MNKKTDNHYLLEKIDLRVEVLSKVNNPSILECFGGKGLLWDSVRRKSKKEFNLLSIEKDPNKNKKAHLTGDSYKFLINMDLSNFNIIDLDAYGIPFKYIDFICRSNFKGYLIITSIQTGMGKLPYDLLISLGFTRPMINKTPILFSKNGFEKLKNYLYLVGVKEITGYFINRKSYFYFKI